MGRRRPVPRSKRRQVTRSERSLWGKAPEAQVQEALLGANVDPEKAEEALTTLQAAVRDVASQETKTEGYARAVSATAACIKLGITVPKIAEVIITSQPNYKPDAEHPNPYYRGAAARYVMLARWELKKYRPGEHHLDDQHKVQIEGHTFYSPVKALNANVASFRRIFMAFRDAIKPESARTIPDKLSEAVADVLEHLSFKMRKGRKVEKVKVAQNAEAMIELLRALLAHPLMEGIMSPATRRSVKQRLEAKAQELDAKAS